LLDADEFDAASSTSATAAAAPLAAPSRWFTAARIANLPIFFGIDGFPLAIDCAPTHVR